MGCGSINPEHEEKEKNKVPNKKIDKNENNNQQNKGNAHREENNNQPKSGIKNNGEEKEEKSNQAKNGNDHYEKEEEVEEEEAYNFFYCFKDEEISLIKELYEKKNSEEQEEKTSILYTKVEMDFTKEEKIYKEYLVVYLSDNCKDDVLDFKGSPLTEKLVFEDLKLQELKKNNVTPFSYGLFNFGDKIEFYADLKLEKEDKEIKIFILEVCYQIIFQEYYGIYPIRFWSQPNTSFSFIFDDNFIVQLGYQRKYFSKISNTELYAFNQDNLIDITLRDKRKKINIENGLSKELLSIFSEDEKKQINFSLNAMGIEYLKENLIYQKVIHKLVGNKDTIKIYYIVFFPHMDSRESSSSTEEEGTQHVIIKKFKINNILVKPSEEEERTSNEVFDGYYFSGKNMKKVDICLNETFAVYELDCESIKINNNFQFNVYDVANLGMRYGSSYKYEIILNGKKVKFHGKFSSIDYKYTKKDDKIIFVGYGDAKEENYNEKEYIKMEREEDDNFQLDDESMDTRINRWTWNKIRVCIPEEFQIIK